MKVLFVKTAQVEQPRPQGAFPWLWTWDATSKARETRPGDEVASRPTLVLKGFPFENDLLAITSAKIMELNQNFPHIINSSFLTC